MLVTGMRMQGTADQFRGGDSHIGIESELWRWMEAKGVPLTQPYGEITHLSWHWKVAQVQESTREAMTRRKLKKKTQEMVRPNKEDLLYYYEQYGPIIT